MYSEKVMEHFRNPHNVGEFENPDGVGTVGNPQCGDTMQVGIMVKDDTIADIRFQTFGCAAAIACSSVMTDMVKGKTIDEALALQRDDVAKELGGLPPVKLHCSNLAADALAEAIKNFREKQK